MEIKEFLRRTKDNSVKFLALDHDIDTYRAVSSSFKDSRLVYALANAFQIIKGRYHIAIPRLIAGRHCNPRDDFRGMRRFFSRVKYKIKNLEDEQFDMVYALGLCDYIKTFDDNDEKGAVCLTRNLFTLVKPGGLLVLGNFTHQNPIYCRFIMDYVYEWNLIYRDEKEMLKLSKSIPEKNIESIEVLKEPLAINNFLVIRKT